MGTKEGAMAVASTHNYKMMDTASINPTSKEEDE